MFIFAQFLEKFAQKQNVPKFLKNLPSFQKLPNTCSPANIYLFPKLTEMQFSGPQLCWIAARLIILSGNANETFSTWASALTPLNCYGTHLNFDGPWSPITRTTECKF